ncbi:flap endonuclease GEN homolog 1 [Rhinichthys klamathensis goyatoka]|uniref:flap endonuclease GEN homolog 1 n=1 Tax=Rhinichthys klamathensis goyatoka TaxID=3034132 RepID=UPI0024B5A32D|nr:flap endonuclease GEN homolog 1 [Rhinichthys klamathensis goyatoka]
MGVSELWSILEPVRQCVPLYSLSGKTLAVDLSLWVCEAQHVQGMMGKVTKPHLRNLFFRVSSLTLMGVKLVFVMEGEAPRIKAETMSKRTEMRFGGLKPKSVTKPAAKNTSRGRFKAVLRECAQLLDCLGVPWVTAAGEAEAMCAFLDSQGAVDGCVTNDGDAFLYGARTVYRNFNMSSKDPQVDCYQMCSVRDDLGLSRDTLVGLAIFLGCDYIPKGVAGVGREHTLKLIHSLKGQTLLQKLDEWRSHRAERSEVAVKKVTHCLVCRHPGSAKAHERSGCVCCGSERFCSPQDYDSQCPCEWHRTEHTRQASALEASIRKKTLACEQFPFTEIISEFLVTKDKPVQPFRRRKPNLMLMQAFALEKMDWPKHYSSEKLLLLITYTELINRTSGRDSHTQIEPKRIHKARVKNGVSCFEVVWKKPDNYVFAEDCEDREEVRTVEEESLFSLAFPGIVQDFHREKAEAQENKVKKKKPKAKQEKPADSHDAVSDLFAQMRLQTDTDPDAGLTQKPPQPEIPEIPVQRSPPSQNSPSESALIGQLHLSTIDWDSSSFTASPDPRSAENSTRSLKDRIMMKNCPEPIRSIPSAPSANPTQNPTGKPAEKVCKSVCTTSVCDSDAENRPGSPKPRSKVKVKSDKITQKSDKITHKSIDITQKSDKITQKSDKITHKSIDITQKSDKITQKSDKITQKSIDITQKSDKITQKSDKITHKPPIDDQMRIKTPEKESFRPASRIQVHHGTLEEEDSDASVDSPRPLAERLKMRFAK